MSDVLNMTPGAATRAPARFGDVPFIVTVFLSATLVFLVQPMFARMATPLLGGSPNVWNVSLVCFQAALLAGYAYAHLSTHFLKTVKSQVILHGVLLVLCALVLPFQLTGMFGAPDPSRPALWLILTFGVSIAPPFAIISATAPLIQAWYARTGRPDAHDPYHLYAASNAGSLLGLAAYPILMEPLAPLATQAGLWSMGYGVLALCLIACGLLAARAPQTVVAVPAVTDIKPETPAHIWRQRLWWVTLAFVPSSLLVGVTSHISTDVASAPFLWAPPLMLYIGSFIVVFAKRPMLGTAQVARLMPLLAGIALFTMSSAASVPTVLSFGVHLAVLFFAAVGCHGLLVADRPATGRLTEFYLLMSFGGVLGGAFNALLVPVIFTTVAEYPLMLIAALLLMPQRWRLGPFRVRIWALLALAALVAAMFVGSAGWLGGHAVRAYFILLMAGLLAVYMARESRIAGAVAVAAIWGIGVLSSPISGGMSERGFFGVVKVLERDGFRLMVHGTTLHGAQAMDGDVLTPATYYADAAPIGQVFAAHDRPGRVGVVGLGVGSVACYARPGQEYVYYEIDPIVARMAKNPDYFTFLSACTPDAPVILGDGRLTLADEPAKTFGLLLIDAFSSDSVPAHMLTREAVQLYLSRTAEDGIVLLHISNRHLALEKVVAGITESLGVPARVQFYKASGDDRGGFGVQSSRVVAIAHNEAALNVLPDDGRWTALTPGDKRPWTDDYSNVIGAFWDAKVNKRP